MSSYLPENKTYAVCTNQLGANYQIFMSHAELRGTLTVGLNKEGTYPLLTIMDRKLDSDFSCKTCWSSGAGTIAFGAGVVTGLAVAATVATVPVVGWIVGGIIAIGCIGYGLYQLFSTPTCNQMIEFDESRWLAPHAQVFFNKHQAVVKTSFISCKEGGMILPFISATAAASAAEDIATINRWDLGINIAGNFIGGGLLGFSLGTMPILTVGGNALLGLVGAYLVMQPLLSLTRSGVRGIEGMTVDDNNAYYDNMTEQKSIPGAIPIIDAQAPQTPSDAQADINGVRTSLYDLRRLGQQANLQAGHMAEINAAIASAEANGGSLAQANNPQARVAFENARNGTYGPEIRDRFTNSQGNGNGMNKMQNYEGTAQDMNRSLAAIRRDRIIANTTNTLNIISLILPFISAGLDESTIMVLAKAASEDLADGTSVMASNQ